MAAKKLDKTAKKALATAQEAVANARKAVRKLDKSARRKADELEHELAVVKKKARKAARRLDKIGANRDEAERSAGTSANTRTDAVPIITAEPAGATAASTTAREPSYRELRDRAKARSIPGYSRMGKAALIDALRGP